MLALGMGQILGHCAVGDVRAMLQFIHSQYIALGLGGDFARHPPNNRSSAVKVDVRHWRSKPSSSPM